MTVDVASVEDELDAIYAAAMRDIADQLVHELAPLVGAARLHAAEELSDAVDSKTRRDLDRIAAVLHAMDELARASSASVEQELNVADCVSEAVAAVDHPDADIELASDDPFPAIGDPALILIVLRNGLANAVEAISALAPDQRRPIVISWGRTASEYRVSILDRGPGLPAEVETLLDLGVTTKGPDHPGLGLALARRAALSLGGHLVIKNADPTGVLFELRWPREK
jgi:signal transduction histidine kinase